jgi:hypothetical protein
MRRTTSVLATATLALVAAAAGIACSSEGQGDKGGVDLSPPPPGKGIQFRMVSELAPGIETERCHFFVAPPDGLAINRQEVRFTPGSHHVLLYSTPYKAIPTKDRFGADVDTSAVFECGKEGPTAHWDVDGVVGGSQTARGPAIIESLPSDVAVKIPAGTVLLMNTHYLNATAGALVTDARINLFTVPAAQVKREAGMVFFYNPFIRIPPKGRAQAREVCPVLSEIFLVNAQSHMHRRGVGYQADLLDPQGNKMMELYQSTDWEDVVMRSFNPARRLEPGQLIDYRCEYDNPEDRVVTQGLSTRDEMCMLVGVYYPRNRQFELCGLDDTWDGGFFGARWVGSGSKTGAETVRCMMAAKPSDMDGGDSFYSCVVDSCPRISHEMSNATRCLVTQGGGECIQDCKSGGEACRACFMPKCQPLMEQLAAARCE